MRYAQLAPNGLSVVNVIVLAESGITGFGGLVVEEIAANVACGSGWTRSAPGVYGDPGFPAPPPTLEARLAIQEARNPGIAATNANISVTNATTVLTGCTFTIPANSLTVGAIYRLTVPYRFTKTTSPPTLTARLTVNGVALASFVIASVSSATVSGGRLEGTIILRSIGSSGLVQAVLLGCNDHGNTSPVNWNPQNGAQAAIDTTVPNDIAIDVQMTTAVAGNTLLLPQGYVELVKA